jgi:hypothetical protein
VKQNQLEVEQERQRWEVYKREEEKRIRQELEQEID